MALKDKVTQIILSAMRDELKGTDRDAGGNSSIEISLQKQREEPTIFSFPLINKGQEERMNELYTQLEPLLNKYQITEANVELHLKATVKPISPTPQSNETPTQHKSPYVTSPDSIFFKKSNSLGASKSESSSPGTFRERSRVISKPVESDPTLKLKKRDDHKKLIEKVNLKKNQQTVQLELEINDEDDEDEGIEPNM